MAFGLWPIKHVATSRVQAQGPHSQAHIASRSFERLRCVTVKSALAGVLGTPPLSEQTRAACTTTMATTTILDSDFLSPQVPQQRKVYIIVLNYSLPKGIAALWHAGACPSSACHLLPQGHLHRTPTARLPGCIAPCSHTVNYHHRAPASWALTTCMRHARCSCPVPHAPHAPKGSFHQRCVGLCLNPHAPPLRSGAPRLCGWGRQPAVR
jgi:hypothetical protein